MSAAPHPVFVAGPLLGRGLFSAQVERFEGATHLETLDRAGTTGLTEWLASELAATPHPRAVIGHGLGAVAALQLAAARPELIDGLMLIGLGVETRVPTTDRDVDRIVEAAFADSAAPEAGRVRGALGELHDDVLQEALSAWAALDLAGRLAAVEQPTLLVAGGQDRLVPLEGAEELARERADAGLAVLPAAGHASPIEASAAIDLLAAAFLARLELALAEGAG